MGYDNSFSISRDCKHPGPSDGTYLAILADQQIVVTKT
jgi:hypothetical protein